MKNIVLVLSRKFNCFSANIAFFNQKVGFIIGIYFELPKTIKIGTIWKSHSQKNKRRHELLANAKASLPLAHRLIVFTNKFGRLELGNIAITPEIRFYMGKGVFHVFYLAPLLRYTNYNASINYGFDS